MRADPSILQGALRKELDKAHSNIGSALHQAHNGAYEVRDAGGRIDNRRTADVAIARIQDSVERYDDVRAQLDALENGTLTLGERVPNDSTGEK